MPLLKILITNANGKTGFAATLQLLAKGYPVRAFGRTQRASTIQLEQAGTEIFIGNMADMATLMFASYQYCIFPFRCKCLLAIDGE